MIIDRIDFVHDEKCVKCGQSLTSGTAYILIDEHGKEVPHGKLCAFKKAGKPKRRIPNFTKGSHAIPGEEGSGNTGGRRVGGHSGTKTNADDRSLDIEYIRLRIERLTSFKGYTYTKLSELYSRIKTAGFNQQEIKSEDLSYLHNIINLCKREKIEYSPRNLQACYAFDFWLSRGISKIQDEDNQKYLKSLQKWLRSKLYLTEKQVAGANKWFSNQKRMPKLKPNTFAKVERSIRQRQENS